MGYYYLLILIMKQRCYSRLFFLIVVQGLALSNLLASIGSPTSPVIYEN
jgi:hypothetical protein